MALTGSEQAAIRVPLAGVRAKIAALLGAEQNLFHRLAGAVFLIRVAAAGIAYLSQILFARWMGSFEFGIYVYVWTWVLLIGQSLDLGLATAAQKFIPQYRDTKAYELLRGYLAGSRWLALGIAIASGLVCAAIVRLLDPWLDDFTIIPLYIACLILPAYAIANVQDGIARSYDWVALGIMPTYVVRQLLLTVLMAAAFIGGFKVDAVTAVILAGVSIWVAAIAQMVVLNRRLRTQVEPGPRQYEIKGWFNVALPILMVEGFYLILAHTDIIILEQFRPPTDVAQYYAAAKTLALVAFVYFAVAATVPHRFSALHTAGDHEGLARLVRQSVRWTFWPSLGATIILLIIGKPLLRLFGADFDQGYHLMYILALGLLARAAIGPVERLLNMLGQQKICAAIYFGAFVINLVLCFALIPRFGPAGAGIATATALIIESILLFYVTKRRLGFHVFVWGGPKS